MGDIKMCDKGELVGIGTPLEDAKRLLTAASKIY
jgi:hypothetical protein